jgi:hypothetical protein
MRRLFVVLAAGLALAGCTAVPDTSSPQVINSVPVEGGGVPATAGPPAGAGARDIVTDFINANGSPDQDYAAAKQYLTPDERTRWNPAATVTVIDHAVVSNLAASKPQPGAEQSGTITVSGADIGTLDASGDYTPSLRGNGGLGSSGIGAAVNTVGYGLTKVKGQWRIDSLPPGLLISYAQFQSFRQYAVYFFDSTEQTLVPVPRYTPLTDPAQIVDWLVSELAAQPPAQLQTGVPQQAGASRVTATYPADPSDPSQPISIEVPGASTLDRGNLVRLAAQFAATLQQVLQVDRLQITDGRAPVRIGGVGTVFPADALAGMFQPPTPDNDLFYVRRGAVYASGRPIPGRVGLGVYGLQSVAVTTLPGQKGPQVAGVRGSGNTAVLDIPDPKTPGALLATSVQGELSRPSWAPGRNEVWIGNGNELERITGPHQVQIVQLNVSQGKATGRVTAVRISPDGGRLALVLTDKDSSQIYIAYIVRNGNQVALVPLQSPPALQPVSPQGVAITDVAWNDQLKLFATGEDTTTGEHQVYEVQCDGSIWSAVGNTGLPGPPDSLTAAASSAVVVSIGDTIWQQSGVLWQSLLGTETEGSNPVYQE